ncbi:hypothetical protein PVL29_006082 [Vitis rotundifolia]|uniref:Uncharacterized protein n=1 Tax=Vitis rotundifolia TaxID=103349 RepID=A0AA39A639_VITRO|nr:hypothetical protein PVL29_006082 [Vitis rotundifolia]
MSKGEEGAILGKTGEYFYSHWNLLASKASPSTGGVGVNDGSREGMGGRLGLQCVREKEEAYKLFDS